MMRLAALLLASLLLPGCTSRVDAARALFVQAKTCPADRVQVSELEGSTLHELRQRQQAKNAQEPPADIRADPARLALWQQQQAESERTMQWVDGRYRLYHASGCDLQEDYACEFLWSQKGWPRGQCVPLRQKLVG